jgi:pimeloyl-ACP methyl ester carboxylesterase
MNRIFFKTEGSGQPVVLIHGFCETSEVWNDFSLDLASSNKIYSIDLPGFGQSPLPETPFTIDQIARMIIDWMDENNIVNPIIIGHSLGGYMALSIAEQAAKIRGIILFHSTAYPDSDEKKINRNKVIEFVKTYGVDPFVDTFVEGLFRDKNHPAIPIVDKMARKTSMETLINYACAMRDRPSRIEFLKSFEKPVLIVGGQWDTIIPPEITIQLGKLNSRGSSFILSEAAHMGMLEQPIEAQTKVKEFILEASN